MHYLALASDYDGTLATHGEVNTGTIVALQRLQASGRKLILVTGRELDELMQIFPAYPLFDRIVAENGAVLYDPMTEEERILSDRPSDQFLQALRDRGVERLSVGRVIVATWRPYDAIVEQVIQAQNLDLQIILNKDAVMVLPRTLDKVTGLTAALQELGLTAEQTVAVGDAENDQTFLRWCGLSVAVANALPIVKEQVDWVTTSDRGAGVTELINRWLTSNFADLPKRKS